MTGQEATFEVGESAAKLLVEQQIKSATLILSDGRRISPRQRNKIFALVGDIARFANGIDKGKKTEQRETLRQMQLLYLLDGSSEEVRSQLTYHYCQLLGVDLFSLSDVDMSTASDFIDWLVELCVQYGIPCTDTLLNRCEDQRRYLYACVANRSCAVCGKRADIHEVDRVGAGRNRREIHHLNQRVQPLCRMHHREVDGIGQESFDEKYHLGWIRLDSKLCKMLGWRE